MPENLCPACGQPLAIADINVAQGVGLCRACGKLSRLDEIADQPTIDPARLANPPRGCRFLETSGDGGVTIIASLRSIGGALALLGFCLFWNGILSIFVLVAIGGLYTNIVGPLPGWFPLAHENGGRNNLHPGMSLGMTLFLCVFITPFVVIGVSMIVGLLLSLFGRIEITISDTFGRVRTGIGPFNRTRQFRPRDVRRVGEVYQRSSRNGERSNLIEVSLGDRAVTFGGSLSEPRRQWLIAVLHTLLLQGRAGRRQLGLRG